MQSVLAHTETCTIHNTPHNIGLLTQLTGAIHTVRAAKFTPNHVGG